jgi:hypothetical protein
MLIAAPYGGIFAPSPSQIKQPRPPVIQDEDRAILYDFSLPCPITGALSANPFSSSS